MACEQTLCLAQYSTIVQTPEPVVDSLESLYPGVKDVQWTREKRNHTADFIHNSLNISITFDKRGHLISCVEEIPFELLPSKVQEKVKQFYGSYKIVMVLQRRTGNKKEYDIEIIQGEHRYILNYHPKGYLIHQYNVYKVDYAATSSW